MTGNTPKDPSLGTDLTDQQAAINDLQGPGRGARQEEGAVPDPQDVDEQVKSDAQGETPDLT